MLSALLYLQYHSIRNSLVRRIQRLRQPKYLFGGIVGVLYFYFYFGRYLFHVPGGRRSLLAAASPETMALIESGAALILLVVMVLAWLLPHERAALTFTEAEVAFLFPAPISRRGLIHFKLVRSQARILFGSVLLMLVTNRFGGRLWTHAAGWWLVLSALSLHWLGSSFARTRLLDRGIGNWARRWVILGLVAGLAVAVTVWVSRTLPVPGLNQFKTAVGLRDYAEKALGSGPLPWLLLPFRLLVRPYFSTGGSAFLVALGPALLILGLLYVWVAQSDVAFEEASVEASKRLAVKLAAVRSGNWRTAGKKLKPKRPPFTLGPAGPAAVGFLWKNLISAGQAFTLRLWLNLLILGVVFSVIAGQSWRNEGLQAALGAICGMLLVWVILLGPQIFRQDFRQDLQMADVLKSYPLPSWQVALGELLAPALILTALEWLLLAVAAALLAQRHDGPGPAPSLVLAIALGAAMVVPMFNFILLQIPNAAVLLFPAWFMSGKAGGGIEATGQRIIFMLGQLLVLALALLPAAIGFAVVFYVSRLLAGLGVASAIPLASAAAAILLAAEVALGVMLLGRLFQKFDCAAEMAP